MNSYLQSIFNFIPSMISLCLISGLLALQARRLPMCCIFGWYARILTVAFPSLEAWKMITNLIILCVIKIEFFLDKVQKVQMITLIDQRVSVWKSTFLFFFSSKACLFKMNIFCILMLRKEIDRLSGRKVINYYSVDLWSLPTDIFSILKCVVIKHLFQW